MISYPPSSNPSYSSEAEVIAVSESSFVERSAPPRSLLIFGASVFLISVPVFFEAPLVRSMPLLCLLLTSGWVWLSIALSAKPQTKHWGELLTGFTWTWLAGSLYWGWFRWEPTLHLPIEAIGLPIALWGLKRNWCKLGNFFYLGSLFGTAVTDLYFYLTDLIPHWRKLMQVEPDAVRPIFQQALMQMYTPNGIFWVISLAAILLSVGIFSLRAKTAYWVAFGGAVLSTILVDSLFWIAATLA
ncbi:DUF3120 domain-containing protein [Pseudanabaenaceae cyanobacterium LEGE 13415]|nr:DUF3120 domain-containing protein [Pseudanabaenaceae cyanobacterium LEGE 13415]